MDHVEAEGNSIDEAIERALAELGVSREKAEIEIVSDAARGILGLGGRKARVRATRRSPLSAAPEAGDAGASARQEEARRHPHATAEGSTPLDGRSIEQARELLAEITLRMGIEVSVEALPDAEGARLALTGDTSGILIGRRGQTLDALEYLVNRIISRSENHQGRIVVDSENYRVRRRQSLEDLARRTAAQVRERGKSVTLNPMSPRDRRIVHLTLQDDRSVVTRSSGEGHVRNLTILPAGAARGRSGERRR